MCRKITDLNGPGSSFPPLDNMNNLKILMLRNCNISGQIPEYLGDVTILKTLDLSFNKLTGQIPRRFSRLTKMENLFLTGNMLTGSVPDWLKADNIDLSYNNFTINSGDENCDRRNLNLFASSSGGNTSSVSCLTNAKCPKSFSSFHINCGGNEETLYENFTRPTNATYEDDSNKAGSSSFYKSSKTNWASSNTGYFTDAESTTDIFIATNDSSILSMTNPQLYKNARLSPISLTYYGFCLENGTYTVNLHFAEIMFIDNKTYYSLGRRVFDIYIQGSIVLKDFNIANEAGGFGKAVGTTGIPYKGVYGPLISAISVDPNFEPPKEPSPPEVVPPGGGSEISGILSDGTVIAVKQLSAKSKQGNREFVNEIGMISALQHPHLVKLYGCCIEGNQLLLVYEYMEKNSLARALFGPEECQLKLDWPTRHNICVGIARGLAYLHEESRLKIVHRDIKATNALLLKENGNLLDLVDPRLGSDFNKEDVMITINVALLCSNVIAADRPTMSSVVSMLEGKASVQEVVLDPNTSNYEINEMRKHFQSTIEENMSENSQRQTMSTEGPWTASSTSVNDLYPVIPDSYYWENRN
ncbi:hypothetical protein M0R45_014559 [Rubus argutus]|uniref:non-specific serine/threonine protein kinase n=1 Tax=Rubus argutus TaxID=59490 RepID=A0AAW1XM51_RUBAR